MTTIVTEEERQRIIAEHEEERKRKLSDHMAALGRSRSAKKRRASRKNVKRATEARMKKRRGKK